ncbi:MAG: ATP-binding protein [Pyrinomonadaceae bacterium]|nr:ATP-binding protein [Sphingobacteriaceae bacterium]
MVINRQILQQIRSKVGLNKVILLFGTRRVGKTVLIKQLEKELELPFLHLNAEDTDVMELLSVKTVANYKRLIGNNKVLIIDEAQVIPDIGKILKLMIDELEITIIATGSSAFDLRNQTGEPLTGRSITYQLYPIAQTELIKKESLVQTRQNLDERLIFGSYPEIFSLDTLDEKAKYLKDLVNAYLLKDILILENIKNSSKIFDLLKLIAYQAGSEVSYDELGKQLGMSKNSVQLYLDLLSKVNILFKLGGFSTNLRKEITKSSKWYFFDNGIRNAIINDFRLPANRNDMGILWENYCMYERIKRNAYLQKDVNYYFWRTYDQQEIDFIENETGKISAADMKWGQAQKRIPAYFAKNYASAEFLNINKDNYLDWIT